MRRTVKGEFASRGIRLWPKGKFVEHEPLLAERVGLKAAHNRGNELAMGSSCGPLLAREKGCPKWRRAEPATFPRDPDLPCFCRPILMALLFCPPFREGV